ncbi:Flp family type IVb pilin [Sphingomonas sp.]|uniref:Flp family type IVb pilin n=1 Tax=Sphingomonas sp. TaxID=28214 RepID=UPI0035C7D02E
MRIGLLRSKRIERFLHRIARERGGTTSIEYGFIMAIIVLAVFVVVIQLADVTKRMWSDIDSRVTSASQ